MCLSEGVSSSEHLHCQVRSSRRRKVGRARGPRKTTAAAVAAAGATSSVVVLGEDVEGAQVSEAQPHALHVEAVGFPLLTLQQVFDTVSSLLLKGNQLLFNLWGAHSGTGDVQD